jgi:hypothetical protein
MVGLLGYSYQRVEMRGGMKRRWRRELLSLSLSLSLSPPWKPVKGNVKAALNCF